MSTVNDIENPDDLQDPGNLRDPESSRNAENPGRPAGARAAAEPAPAVTQPTEPASRPADEPAAPMTGGDAAPARAERSAAAGDTSVYVRRGRTPTLGFWIAIALAAPAVLALLSAPFFDFVDLGGIVNFVLIAVVFCGLPLAAVVAAVDAYRHRERAPRRR